MAITVKHNKVSTVPDGDDTSVVRPSDWNADHTLVGTIDVANGGTGASTASAGLNNLLPSQTGNNGKVLSTDGINASWSTNGSGDVVGPSSSTDNAIARFDNTTGKLLQNSVVTVGDTGQIAGVLQEDFTSTTAPAYLEGRVWYDSTEKALAFYNDSSSIAVHVSQDLIVKVINNTGSTIPNGSPVYVTSTSSGQTYPNVALAKADVAATSAVIGLTNGSIANGATGYVTSQGIIDNVNTGTFTVGQVLYLSPYSAGQLMNTIPPTGITVQVGVATFINSSTGHIYVKQTTPLAVPASIITGQVAVANGGTGASTASGARTNLGLGTIATQDASAVAITGGTINGTTIGATTPSTGVFTTLTGNSTSQFGAGSANYIQIVGAAAASDPVISAQGSDTNIDLVLSPKGTGAIQAQATTSTTAGGNVRGANAVDWQTSRGAASQVASGQLSVISGGINNVASQYNSSIVCGFGNSSTGIANFIGSGSSNTGSGSYSAIVGGVSNTSAGLYNFIGGGFTNSGTANAAVTTQSGTMNATTAVTLSGSNANIKVGQYITGTSIANDTYVAAISGTALTLSKVASGSSTSTLSFFTPHGVVVGGGNNQATGSYSFIGGGGDAGTAANRNVASGDWSVVGGGFKNTASGLYSTVVGGYGNTANQTGAFVGGGGYAFGGSGVNTASGQSAGVVAGIVNTASGNASFVGAGYSNTANSQYGAVMGGSFGTTRSISGNHVFSACQNPVSQTNGINQSALLILARQTTDATATALCSDANAASGTNQVILPNNSAYFFTGEVVSGVTGGGNTKGWTIEGVIKRGANAASTALVGTPTVTSMYADVGAATWAIAVTADTTNGGIRVTFTGQASTTIRTVCQIRTTEMTY